MSVDVAVAFPCDMVQKMKVKNKHKNGIEQFSISTSSAVVLLVVMLSNKDAAAKTCGRGYSMAFLTATLYQVH